ncbi:putative methyltransferase, partial [Thermococci archaeon]
MRGIIAKVEEKTTIPVYGRTVENVLGAVLASGDLWRIIDLSEEPLPLATAVLKALNELGYIEFNEEILLTKKGKELVEKYGIGKR